MLIRENAVKFLSADEAGQNINTAQPWFPTGGAVELWPNARYYFRGQLWLARAAGTTSHTTALLFGGTAQITTIDYLAGCKTGDTNALAAPSWIRGAAATALVVKAASTAAAENMIAAVEGYLSTGMGGTLIPRFQYSAAPGGAPTIKRGTFFMLQAIGAGSGKWS